MSSGLGQMNTSGHEVTAKMLSVDEDALHTFLFVLDKKIDHPFYYII
jgi:hypothetical protein